MLEPQSCEVKVQLKKKPGKGLGMSLVGRKDGKGVFISDMVTLSLFVAGDYYLKTLILSLQIPGGAAEASGRIARGDQLMFVEDHDLSQAGQDEAVAVLRTVTGVVNITLRRGVCNL